MKRLNSFYLLLIFAFSVALVTLIGCKAKGVESEINIGVNLPLTGDLSTYGEAIKNGISLALNDLNAKRKEKDPILNFDWQDNAGQPKNAVSIMQKQFLKKVDLYISGVKPQTMAIIDEIQKKEVPHFVWIFDAFVTKNYKNVLRTWVSYKYEPEYYLQYISRVKPKRVAIIYVNLPHSEEEFKSLVIPKLANFQVEKVMTEAYDWNKMDFKDIASKVKNFNPDLIVLNGFKSTIIGLVRSLKESNLIKDGNTIGTYDMLDAAEELPANIIEGIRVVTPIFNTRLNEQTENWKIRFERQFGRKPRYTDAYAYDMTNIIFQAARNIPTNPTSADWYKSIKSIKLKGITGDLSFDEDGDLVISLEIGVYRNGKLLPDVMNTK